MGLIRVVVAAEFLVVMWLDRGGSSNDGRSSGDNSSDSDTTVVIAVLAMDDREGERTQLPNILGPKLSNRTMSRGPRTASHQHLIYHTLPSSSLQVCLATPPPPHTHTSTSQTLQSLMLSSPFPLYLPPFWPSTFFLIYTFPLRSHHFAPLSEYVRLYLLSSSLLGGDKL